MKQWELVRTRQGSSRSLVDVGDGVLVFASWTATFRADDDVVTLEAHLVDGRYRVAELTYRASNVTGEALRDVPVATLVEQAAQAVAYVIVSVEGTAKRRRFPVALRHHRPSPEGGPTDEAMRWVASAYRIAATASDRPTKLVADAVGLAPATASRWVARARDRGYLTAPAPRRPKED